MLNYLRENILIFPWLVVGIYFVISAVKIGRRKERESPATLYPRIAMEIVAWYLLYEHRLPIEFLNRRFVPEIAVILAAGVALTYAGMILTLWARYCLGKFWNASVSLQQGHELIRSGPYARLRHPIYSGILLALVGMALAIGKWRALAAFALVLIGFTWKARTEESALAREFGERYAAYRQQTGFLLPHL
ncbi:MAG: methyltransferase family protein [Candidatus Acidiferrales bacterium]